MHIGYDLKAALTQHLYHAFLEKALFVCKVLYGPPDQQKTWFH